MRRLLFVCTANVCRSPMAEAIFNALATDRSLPCRAESAGVAALEGEPITTNARTALAEIGFYADGHRARQVSEKMLKEADLVLTMTSQHAARLRGCLGDQPHKIFTLPGYATVVSSEESIPDPYGLTMFAYRACVRQLFEYIERIVNDLEQ
jgi:protein-tyrosine phosphatase